MRMDIVLRMFRTPWRTLPCPAFDVCDVICDYQRRVSDDGVKSCCTKITELSKNVLKLLWSQTDPVNTSLGHESTYELF